MVAQHHNNGVSLREHEAHKEICARSFDEIKALLHDINNRLFQDNGSASMQTRVNRNEDFIASLRCLIHKTTLTIFAVGLVAAITLFWRMALLADRLAALPKAIGKVVP